MPPKPKITPEMIVQAGFTLVRRDGPESLNARSLSKDLGCSTQPILYHFPSMEKIRQAVYQVADAYHSAYIFPKTGESVHPLLSLGLSYIRFAHEEKNLFRFLFMSGQFQGMDFSALLHDPAMEPILDLVAQDLGGQAEEDRKDTIEEATECFLTLLLTAHGYASLLAGGAMAYDENQAEQILTRAYEGMQAIRRKG